VLFRIIDKHKPTVLADECDAWINDNEELRGLLNAGHRRGGQALRCEGDNNEVRAFAVFSPAVLCGIGSLPGTLYDRSIVIRLERAKPGEVRQRFDPRHTERETELCRKLARFVADNMTALELSDPKLPDCAFNRLADNWRPLFAIAEIAGGDWPQRCVDAFVRLTTQVSEDAESMRVLLLADIQQMFEAERMFSKDLVEKLAEMKDRPWPEANRGKPITEHWLARNLGAFDIRPKLLRIGEGNPARGYELEGMKEAFNRYLPRKGGFLSVIPLQHL
jgi:putative DNA primase/helicase